MKIIALLLLLIAPAVAQVPSATYSVPSNLLQPGDVHPHHWLQGQQYNFWVSSNPSSNNVQLHSYAQRFQPVPLGGGWNDYYYDVGDYLALFMMAPGPAALVPIAAAVPAWSYMFCDPNTVQSTIMTPSCCLTYAINPQYVQEQVDTFEFYEAPLSPSLIGTTWIAQWARSYEGYTVLSSGVLITIN